MELLSFGDYSLNALKSSLSYKGKVLDLEPQVYCLLELLITRRGELISRDEIIAKVWDGRMMGNSVIDNRIRAARAAIGDTGKAQRYIKTYPGRGYKFIANVLVSNDATASPDTKTSAVDSVKVKAVPINAGEINAVEKPAFSFFSISGLRLAGVMLSGFLGLYGVSQTMKATGTPDAVSVEAVDNTDIYKLAATANKNALPRIAILPMDVIGERSAYGLMPEVFESQFNNSITAIRGVTVVSLSTAANANNDITNYNALKEEFGLDYVIASKLSPYGEDFKLNVSLIRVDDSSALFNEVYDLKSAKDGGLKDLPADIALKATLATANKLSLSMDGLPKSWRSYDFYLKIEEAKAIGEPSDYESTKKASQILREAIEEEPNYLPAYLLLHSYLAWSASYFGDDYQALYKEQAELPPKMKEISPNAPETLIINLYMDSTVDGLAKGSLGEYDPSDPVSVMNYILEKDPDHVEASLDAAYMSAFKRDQPETVRAYENVMRLVPTSNIALMEYSQALFCNEEIDRAHIVLQRLKKWYPDHRFSILAELRESQALGDYKTALTALKQLLDQGFLYHDETKLARALFFDFGYPELALPHVRFPPARAHVHAMMESRGAALEEAEVITDFYTSVRARMIVDENYFPNDYSAYSTYGSVGEPNGVTQANACYLDYLMRDTYILERIGSEKFFALLQLLTDYFEDKNPLNLKTQQEYTALMGLHALQGNQDKAIEVMDIAMDRGFLFIGSFKEPHLRELTRHSGFSERIDKMQASADKLFEEYFISHDEHID